MQILIYIVIVVVIGFIAYMMFSGGKRKGKPFYLRSSLMRRDEKDLFKNLNRRLGDKYLIFSKVRIEDFVGVKKQGLKKGEHFGLRNRIKSRHVDFLICDLIDVKPLLAIELDGKSHNSYKRKERDNYLDRVYSGIGLKYLHIRVGSNFEQEAVKIEKELISIE